MIATQREFNPVVIVVGAAVGLTYCKSGHYGTSDKDIILASGFCIIFRFMTGSVCIEERCTCR